jgi:MazG family protein
MLRHIMSAPAHETRRGIDRLLDVMAQLRDPQTGCPWDIAQTFATIAPYTIEEAYEVAEAIRNGDMAALQEELGDLLLQVVYHAQMAGETGAFDFDAVAHGIADKMIRRHPHVFGDGELRDVEAQRRDWEYHKAAERARKAAEAGRAPSALDDVALGFPALTRAEKLQKRAARNGFDWDNTHQVLTKLDEEVAEVRAELTKGDRARLQDEVGDLLFTVANLARKLDIDPEVALRDSNAKFERRYRGVEARLEARGQTAGDCDLDTLEDHWRAVKATERNGDTAGSGGAD